MIDATNPTVQADAAPTSEINSEKPLSEAISIANIDGTRLLSDINDFINATVTVTTPPVISRLQAAAAAAVLGGPSAAPQETTPPPPISGIFKKNKRAVSDTTRQIIEGLVEGYLYKEKLHPREKA